MMTKDDLKKHGTTAGIAAAVAVLVALAFRATTVTGIGSEPVSPNATRVDLPLHAQARTSSAPPNETCKLAEGSYDSLAAAQAKATGCTVQVITERPYALMECGNARNGIAVRRKAGSPNARFAVDCSLANPN